jgi:putative DNA methylase
VLKPDGIMTLMFTHKATGAWDAFAPGLMEAGFTITASWPINTEAEGSLHIKDKSAANSDRLPGVPATHRPGSEEGVTGKTSSRASPSRAPTHRGSSRRLASAAWTCTCRALARRLRSSRSTGRSSGQPRQDVEQTKSSQAAKKAVRQEHTIRTR